MKRTFLISGALMGMIGIVLGAFGAHGLEKIAEPDAVDSFETGVRYQIYHAFLLLFLGLWDTKKQKVQRFLLGLLLIGVVLFSGSIYGLVLDPWFSFEFKKLALLTPLGGTLLILAWGLLVWTFFKSPKA
ncbi:MAG: DUF423 domain-containing protein [Bacteroidota bacterium]